MLGPCRMPTAADEDAWGAQKKALLSRDAILGRQYTAHGNAAMASVDRLGC